MRIVLEVKYSKFCSSGELQHDISIDDFLKLYINHRPLDLYEADRDLISHRFGDLCRVTPGVKADAHHIQWALFQDTLAQFGEKLSATEMHACVMSLACEASSSNTSLSASWIKSNLLGWRDVPSSI